LLLLLLMMMRMLLLSPFLHALHMCNHALLMLRVVVSCTGAAMPVFFL
jgi:hypothetical protein